MTGGEAASARRPLTGMHTRKSALNSRLNSSHEVEAQLQAELEKLKKMVGMGLEVCVRWLPGTVKYRNGKQLLEEVSGDTIVIYSEDPGEASQLLRHGFAEWLLNQQTKRYRLLINKLIELFEQIQYEEKERIVEALTKLMTPL